MMFSNDLQALEPDMVETAALRLSLTRGSRRQRFRSRQFWGSRVCLSVFSFLFNVVQLRIIILIIKLLTNSALLLWAAP